MRVDFSARFGKTANRPLFLTDSPFSIPAHVDLAAKLTLTLGVSPRCFGYTTRVCDEARGSQAIKTESTLS